MYKIQCSKVHFCSGTDRNVTGFKIVKSYFEKMRIVQRSKKQAHLKRIM